MNPYVRIRDMFAHLGIAVALGYAGATISNVYGTPFNMQLPLPPYPHNRIITDLGLSALPVRPVAERRQGDATAKPDRVKAHFAATVARLLAQSGGKVT